MLLINTIIGKRNKQTDGFETIGTNCGMECQFGIVKE